MQFRLKKTMTQVTVLAALLPSLTLLVNEARAHERQAPATKFDPAQSPARGDYAYHSSQSAVRTGMTGECVGTGTWSVEGATVECHPSFFASPDSAASSVPGDVSASSVSADSSATSAAAAGATAAGVAAGAAASAASVQKLDPNSAPERGDYVYDNYGRNARTGVTGECVKTGTWTYNGATLACDPDLFAGPGAAPRAQAAPEPAAEPVEESVEYEAMQYEDAPAVSADPAPAAAEAADADDFFAPGDDPDLLPVPSPDSFPPEPADTRISDPVMYYEEQEGVAQDDGIMETLQYGNDDSGIVPDDGIGETLLYGNDDSGIVPDDGIGEIVQYGNDDSGIVPDDGITAHHQFGNDDSGIVPDDGIGELVQYGNDDSGIVPDDGITAHHQFGNDDSGMVAEEGITGQTLYHEESGAVAADDLIGEPKAFDDEPMAQEVVEPAPTAQAAPEPVPAAEAAPAPEPVAEATTPAAVEPEPVILPVTITLEAEALFDFDRSKVRSGDQERLDKLVTGLSGVDYDRILVVGHADRIGTDAYNERLSLRRANAVKEYMVKQGVESGRITTEGRGEFEPSTDPAACKGMRSKKLIDCLQPDRRVEVTVTGQSQKQ